MDQQAQQVRWEEESMGRKGMKCRPSCRQLERTQIRSTQKKILGQGLGWSQTQNFCAQSPCNQNVSPSWHTDVFTTKEGHPSLRVQSFNWGFTV